MRLVYLSDGNSQLDSYDGLGNRLSTAFYEAVTPVVAGKIPSRSRLVATRYYYGDGTVCRGDSVVMTRFGGGYFDGEGKPCYELADYQGNISTVIDSDGAIVSHTGFYPYGQPWRRPGELSWLYGGKEWLGADGRDEYDFHARRQYPHLGIFTTPDPHAESCHDISPYAYCAGNPIMFIDPTGENTYRVAGDGNFYLLYEDDNEKDVIYNDNLDASIEVSKDFMASHRTVKGEFKNEPSKTRTSQLYRLTEDSDKLYSFLCDNTNVEWSQLKMLDDKENYIEFIGTSNQTNYDTSWSVINEDYRNTSAILFEFTHHHPTTSSSPTDSDFKAFETLFSKWPNARMIVTSKQSMPTIITKDMKQTNTELFNIDVYPTKISPSK